MDANEEKIEKIVAEVQRELPEWMPNAPKGLELEYAIGKALRLAAKKGMEKGRHARDIRGMYWFNSTSDLRFLWHAYVETKDRLTADAVNLKEILVEFARFVRVKGESK